MKCLLITKYIETNWPKVECSNHHLNRGYFTCCDYKRSTGVDGYTFTRLYYLESWM